MLASTRRCGGQPGREGDAGRTSDFGPVTAFPAGPSSRSTRSGAPRSLLASMVRARFPDAPITESHPKALLRARGLDEAVVARQFGIPQVWRDDHQRDAAIAAVCAREGFEGRWRIDLAEERDGVEQDPRDYWLAPMHYFWFEAVWRRVGRRPRGAPSRTCRHVHEALSFLHPCRDHRMASASLGITPCPSTPPPLRGRNR